MVDHAGRGLDPAEACGEALRELLDLPDEFRAPLQAPLAPRRTPRRRRHREGATYGATTAQDAEPRILPRAVA